MNEIIDVSSLKENGHLGQGMQAVILVKWLNQSYHDDNLRSMFTGDWDEKEDISRSNVGRHRQQYYDGLVGCFDLSADFLDASNASFIKNEIQPTDVDISESSILLAAGNRIIARKHMNDEDETHITNPWFARLHSVEQIDENRILTVSSAFDQIYIVNNAGAVVKNIDIWEHGRNTNKFGHRMLRATSKYSEPVRYNPSVESLKQVNTEPSQINVIDDPHVYKGLGLPTYLTPTFVNHVGYDKDKQKIMATTLQTGECWMIDPETNAIEVTMKGLNKPHGLRKYGDGYIVTDSGRESILILDEHFRPKQIFSTANFKDRKKGLEKAFWLQNTTNLSEDILITISIPRQKLTLIDVRQREYRDIPFDTEWGVQTVKPYTKTF